MEKEAEYLEICEELKKIINETGEPLEGNCMYQHLSFEPLECLLNKRINFQTLAKNKKNICEIGFNAGHSLLAMLLVNPDAKYVLFDLGSHKYAKPCFEYLQAKFPDTDIKIIWGDSRVTLPGYHLSNPDVVFDLVHIDGGHKYEIYSKDWENSISLVLKGGIIIFDDTDNAKIGAFVNTEIEKGIVKEANCFLETFGYKHRILIKE